MGTFHEPIEICNPAKPGKKISLDALVDTGAAYTLIPGKLLKRIGIKPVKTRRFKIGNGKVIERSVGLAVARVQGEETPTWVIFGDDDAEPLLGAYTLEGLALGVDSLHRNLVPVASFLLAFPSQDIH
jgi:clan AA aspartic protease